MAEPTYSPDDLADFFTHVAEHGPAGELRRQNAGPAARLRHDRAFLLEHAQSRPHFLQRSVGGYSWRCVLCDKGLLIAKPFPDHYKVCCSTCLPEWMTWGTYVMLADWQLFARYIDTPELVTPADV
jgi:hypothetical protein